jgi:hypothetical protein
MAFKYTLQCDTLPWVGYNVLEEPDVVLQAAAEAGYGGIDLPGDPARAGLEPFRTRWPCTAQLQRAQCLVVEEWVPPRLLLLTYLIVLPIETLCRVAVSGRVADLAIDLIDCPRACRLAGFSPVLGHLQFLRGSTKWRRTAVAGQRLPRHELPLLLLVR